MRSVGMHKDMSCLRAAVHAWSVDADTTRPVPCLFNKGSVRIQVTNRLVLLLMKSERLGKNDVLFGSFGLVLIASGVVTGDWDQKRKNEGHVGRG